MLRELMYVGVRGLIKAYTRLMFDFDVVWHAGLPDGAKIVAPNHPTTIDPFLIASLFPGEPRVLINEILFKVPIGGTVLRLLEQVPVVDGHGRIAYETAKWLLSEGHTVIVFPEGQISPAEGGFCPPHTGVARLALETGAPVIPVGIHLDRTRIRTVETEVEGQPEMGTWYFRGPYAVTMGEAGELVGDVTDRPQVRQLVDQLMWQIAELSHESALRMEQPAVGKLGQRVVRKEASV